MDKKIVGKKQKKTKETSGKSDSFGGKKGLLARYHY